MTFTLKHICLNFLFTNVLLLVFQIAFAQTENPLLDRWLNDHVDEMGGRAILMIYKDGKVIYNKSVNRMNGRQKIGARIMSRNQDNSNEKVYADYTPQTRIPIASASKWLSAALVMTFVDDGTLKLEDSVGKYLPVMSKKGKGNITVKDCLSHLTGIKSGNIRETRELSTTATSMEESIERIASMPMESDPGTSFHYSSAGLQIAAAVIEKISGKSFEKLFQERIAIPCEINHTSFGKSNVPLAAGGALSTAADYMNFVIMILNKGVFNKKRILSEGSIEAMQKNYIAGKKIIYSPANAITWGYGLGEWTMSNDKGNTTSVSSPGLFGTFPWVDNQHKYAGILFTMNLKNKGRDELYRSLKQTADAVVTSHR